MMKQLLQVLFFLLCSGLLMGQYPQRGPGNGKGFGMGKKLKGVVMDQDSQEPLEYASISVLSMRDSSLVGGGISDPLGQFEIDVKAPRFFVKIEFIGYEEQWVNPNFEKENLAIDIGQVFLSPAGELLEDIEIRAEKSESQFMLDKQVFNVGKDLANRGGSAEDILDNVPSITVDIEGGVSLRGSGGVKILIDGKPSGLVGADNINGLRSIPSNTIDRIEVITNPSARYEAEGMAGIINIILKKNTGHGFNGAFTATLGIPETYGLGANVNYRKGKLNWFASYNINLRSSVGGGFNYQERLVDTDLLVIDQQRDMERESFGQSIRFGADYFLNDKEQLTGALSFSRSSDDNMNLITYDDYTFTNQNDLWKLTQNELDDALLAENLIQHTDRTDIEKEKETNQEYSLNYLKQFSSDRHTLNALVQFSDHSEVEGSDLNNTATDANGNQIPTLPQRSNNDEGNQTLLAQIDYVHPFSKTHKWEAGLRSSIREIRNKFSVEDFVNDQWVSLNNLSNDFTYAENIYAAYGIYGNGFGNWSYQVGLRTELAEIRTELLETDVNGVNERSFLNLFPSGHLNYKLSDANAFQISYSRRVRRPRFWDLNPFFTFSDFRNFFSGNPFVNPEYTNSYEISNINIWEKFTLTAGLFYRTTDATIQRISAVQNVDGTTLTIPLNIGDVKDSGLDVNLSYTGFEWLRVMLNANVFRTQRTANSDDAYQSLFDYYTLVRAYEENLSSFQNEFAFDVRDIDNIAMTGSMTLRFSFLDSDLELRGRYRGPVETVQGRTKTMGMMDLGWSKDLLQNKMTLTIGVRDVFNSRRRRGSREFDNFYSDLEFQWRGRTANATLSYRLNQKKKRGGGRGGNYSGDSGDF